MKASATDKNRPTKIGRSNLPNDATLALGMNLKMVREAAGITQVDLAFDAEVERSRISKIEVGM